MSTDGVSGNTVANSVPIGDCCVRLSYVEGRENGPRSLLILQNKSTPRNWNANAFHLAPASYSELFRPYSWVLAGLASGSSVVLATCLLHELAWLSCLFLVLYHSRLKK